jgi:hypothetical protein
MTGFLEIDESLFGRRVKFHRIGVKGLGIWNNGKKFKFKARVEGVSNLQ